MRMGVYKFAMHLFQLNVMRHTSDDQSSTVDPRQGVVISTHSRSERRSMPPVAREVRGWTRWTRAYLTVCKIRSEVQPIKSIFFTAYGQSCQHFALRLRLVRRIVRCAGSIHTDISISSTLRAVHMLVLATSTQRSSKVEDAMKTSTAVAVRAFHEESRKQAQDWVHIIV